jgi:hypothetical protein
VGVTLREAIRVLEGEGYVETRRGSMGGVTVLDRKEAPVVPTAIRPGRESALRGVGPLAYDVAWALVVAKSKKAWLA